MIPAYFPEDAPPGEKAVYRALAQSKDTDDWVVLHSLAIADHLKKPESEADFVIIAPSVGILGSTDVVVGHFRPGSGGQRPPRVSMAMAMSASGLWNP